MASQEAGIHANIKFTYHFPRQEILIYGLGAYAIYQPVAKDA
jgi:hypothetical protein